MNIFCFINIYNGIINREIMNKTMIYEEKQKLKTSKRIDNR